MRLRSNLVRTAALCFLFLTGSGLAWGAGSGQGLFFPGKDGKPVPAPVLGATVEVKVTGIIARTRVTQIFTNPSQEWLEGIYVFPLPADGAVDTLRMKVGDRTIQGVIQEKDEARRTYETAKQQGMKTTLIEQQRPDVFTTAMANVGPGETVEVAIELQQVVQWDRDRFRWRFPMVVTPYEKGSGRPGPPVRPRGAPPINPFAFHADLNPGFPLAKVESPSHAVTVAAGKNFRYAVDLKKGVEPADSDLILEWAPAVGREPRGVFYSEEVDGERFDLLMVMPPDAPEAAAARLPRETILIVDTSGSMSGTSIEQARRALLLALDKLQPSDWLNVIRFSDSATSAFPASVPASRDAVEKARRFISGLQADGGTSMLPALQIAFRNPAPASLVPQVIFATDGQFDDQEKVVNFLSSSLGVRRLFPVAIGSAPNAALLRRLAALGGGSFTQIPDSSQVAPVMSALFGQLEAPMLQRIEVQWGDPSAEAWPARIPDLYLGEPLVLTARSSGGGPVSVSGTRGGSAWNDSFPMAAKLKGAGIDKLWARRKIQALMDSLHEGADAKTVRQAVTDLGLRHHLVTEYTSLVAVDDQPTAPANARPVTRIVPVNPPRQEEIVMTDPRYVSTGATVSRAELDKIPTAPEPWPALEAASGGVAGVVGGTPGGVVGGTPGSAVGPPEGEAKALCAEIQRSGWNGITLDKAMAAAPSLKEALRKAADAGLLRGFLALVLRDKGCSQPQADVLVEAQRYEARFGLPKG
ncbi:MAG TPA: VIT domain-containing protein [Thermoanaerobaculia bacterium]|nr:VIT domain-containing protein [Thermoanaerobaculia bacterium]